MNTKTIPDEYKDMAAALFAARKFVMAGVVLAFLASTLFCLVMPECFEARMLISPHDKAASAWQENEAQASALTPYAGENIDIMQARYLSLLHGRLVAKALGHNVEWLEQHLKITPVGQQGQYLLTLRGRAAEDLVKKLQKAHRAADNTLRFDRLNNLSNRKTYLRREMTSLLNAENRAAFSRLLAETEQQKMLAAMDKDFAVYVVEQPYALDKPVWPRPAIIIPLCMLLGAILGFAFHIFKNKADA